MTGIGKKLLLGALVLLLAAGSAGTASAEGLIKKFENGSVTAEPLRKAIPDTNGRWQIGFGSTWNYDANRWVRSGDTITAEQASRWMRTEIREKQDLLKKLVKVPLSANQFNALTSFMYNVGSTAFTDSTLLRLLNQGKAKQVVAMEFDKWIYSGGQILQGLVNRRAAEKALFLS